MEIKDLEYKFNSINETVLASLNYELKNLEKLSRRYRNDEKLNLIHKEIKSIKYIISFSQRVFRNEMDQQFLNLMFESYNPYVDYRKMTVRINQFILSLRSECMADSIRKKTLVIQKD